jgi:hypothetical protein
MAFLNSSIVLNMDNVTKVVSCEVVTNVKTKSVLNEEMGCFEEINFVHKKKLEMKEGSSFEELWGEIKETVNSHASKHGDLFGS